MRLYRNEIIRRIVPTPVGVNLVLLPLASAPPIVPTPVGVNRFLSAGMTERSNCPHARGGEPVAKAIGLYGKLLSPRPWG